MYIYIYIYMYIYIFVCIYIDTGVNPSTRFFPDDVQCRAAMLSNAAACLRRARRPEEAVQSCDMTLSLVPRFSRALYR